MTTHTLAEGLHLIDLKFQGLPGVIGAYLIEDSGERALVEIGPTSALDGLLSGLRELAVPPESISKVLVTHIHLDHVGAAGTFMQRFTNSHLFVHEIGAPHMIDPSKLLASATRIYGERMESLWGAFDPVPPDRITILRDENVISVGERQLVALYTPGHASHHIAYHDIDRGLLFTGDVAAVRLQGREYIRPPTPPPDLDLEAWDRSIARMRKLQPRALNLTHFGPFTDTERHLTGAQARLHAWGEIVRTAQRSGKDRSHIVDALTGVGDHEIEVTTGDREDLQRYEIATPYGMTVDGYLRYFRKRAQS